MPVSFAEEVQVFDDEGLEEVATLVENSFYEAREEISYGEQDDESLGCSWEEYASGLFFDSFQKDFERELDLYKNPLAQAGR